mgnify:CR=1 FL=1
MVMSSIDEIKLLAEKREALERLINAAKQVTRLAGSLDALKELVKPSQQASTRLKFLQDITVHFDDFDTQELSVRLSKLDGFLQSDYLDVVKLSEFNEQELLEKYGSNVSDENVQSLSKRLQDFRRRAQTDVAIRVILHGRGVPLHALEFPMSQEQLQEKASEIKKKESHCKEKVKSQLEDTINTTRKILSSGQYPKSLKDSLLDVHKELRQSLDLLNQGKSIEDIPSLVETIDIESAQPAEEMATPVAADVLESPTITNNAHNTKSPTNEPARNSDSALKPKIVRVLPPKQSFMQQIKSWLNLR